MATEMTTVVFTDLVDSTALMSSVGEDVAEDLRREHFALLRLAIDRAGGTEVKNLGDGLMAVFASTSDAVRAAVGAQQALHQRNRRAVHPLEVRMGISSGDADVEDGDYFGVPVVQAARLCAKAEGGEILVAEVVRLLSGSRGGFTFEAVGELELKGLDRPVAACRVAWKPLNPTAGQPPLPARLVAATAANFVGRDFEHERLRSVWKTAATEGRRQVMLLAGEPGIGKTTLAARLAGEVHEAGGTVLYGRCDEDLGIAYQPWVEALTQLVEQTPEVVLRDHVDSSGPHLARLVPALARRLEVPVPPDAGDAELSILVGCAIDLLARAATDQPVLVVLDDLHWADPGTIRVLRQVVTTDRPMAVALLGTFRDSDVTANDPMQELLARLHREPAVDRLPLTGWSDSDLLAWLESVAGHEMDEVGLALRDALLGETAGNPFFVGEVLRHLVESGAIRQSEGGRWVGTTEVADAGLPVSVKEVVGRRLATLGPDTERVLAFAAVIGRDFQVGVLARVSGVGEDGVIDLCDAAVTAAVLRTTEDPDHYTFAHALIEHTLYDGLSPARRARAHRAVAEAIEAIEGPNASTRAAELAFHWSAAVQPSDLDKAIHYAALAARTNVESAPEEALRWSGQALDLLERMPSAARDEHLRVELLIERGVAEVRCGRAESRQTLLDAAALADSLDDRDLTARAVLENSRGFWSDITDADHERIAMINRALGHFEGPDHADDPNRARLLALAAVEQYFVTSLDHRLALVEEAVRIARHNGDPRVLAWVLFRCEIATRGPSTLDQRTAWMAEVVEIDARWPTGSAFNFAGNNALVALEAADPILQRAELARMHALGARTPHAPWRWEVTYSVAFAQLCAGELARSEELMEEALAFGTEHAQHNAFNVYAAQLMNLRHHQGRIHELVDLIADACAASPRLSGLRGALGLACARGDDRHRATEVLDQGFDIPMDYTWITALACLAEAAVLVEHEVAAEQIRDRLEPYAHHIPTTGVTVHPPVAHYLGLIDHLPRTPRRGRCLVRRLGRDRRAVRLPAAPGLLGPGLGRPVGRPGCPWRAGSRSPARRTSPVRGHGAGLRLHRGRRARCARCACPAGSGVDESGSLRHLTALRIPSAS